MAVAGLVAGRIPGLDESRIHDVFDHSRIARRQFMMPMDWYLSPRSPGEQAQVFRERGLDLMLRASTSVLEKAGVTPAEVDHVIFATTTGLSTPSLDSHLITRLGMRPETGRIPVWGLGCAAGAAGISRAGDYCLAHPGAHVLLVALECCSLTFLPEDLSKRNLVAMSLFADGCAAVLVAGDGVGAPGPRILATRSHLFPGTERVMGWDVTDQGLRLVLAPDLPEIVRRETAPLVDAFLLSRDLSRRDVAHYIVHPGGAKVVDAVREALGLGDGALRITEDVLHDHGNVSSASVLVVLERWMEDGACRDGGDRKSTRLNSSHNSESRMPSSA
jgi:alkylresorcinol/alkylpyrone synthase